MRELKRNGAPSPIDVFPPDVDSIPRTMSEKAMESRNEIEQAAVSNVISCVTQPRCLLSLENNTHLCAWKEWQTYANFHLRNRLSGFTFHGMIMCRLHRVISR